MTPRSIAVAAAASFALAVPSFAVACGDDTDAPPGAPSNEGGIPDEGGSSAPDASTPTGPHPVAMTTHAPSSSASAAVATNATWAAWADGSGAWQALAPVTGTAGSYAFVPTSGTWSVAFACEASGASSAIAVIERTSATTSLDVGLDADCSPPAPPPTAIGGLLVGAGVDFATLDYGYALDRGTVSVAFDIETGQASFVLPGLAQGTWDLFFASRDPANGGLSRLSILRGWTEATNPSLAIDVTRDFFSPGARTALVHGTGDAASVSASVLFTSSGPNGISVAPASFPVTKPDVTFVYATVPADRVVPSDRYVFQAQATTTTGQARTLSASFHTPIAIEATLPAALAAPQVKIGSPAPYLRLDFAVLGRGGDATYDVLFEEKPSPTTHRRWRSSRDASLGPNATMPDLSGAPGWKTSWALPGKASVSVNASAIELPTTLSDGTLTRVTSATTTFTPATTSTP